MLEQAGSANHSGEMREDETAHDALLPDQAALKIPNREVADIFRKSVKSWFAESASKSNRSELFKALWSGDAVGLRSKMD